MSNDSIVPYAVFQVLKSTKELEKLAQQPPERIETTLARIKEARGELCDVCHRPFEQCQCRVGINVNDYLPCDSEPAP